MTRFSRIVIAFLLINIPNLLHAQDSIIPLHESPDLLGILEIVYRTEQAPIRTRDSLMNIYGTDSKEADVYQKLFKNNHAVNAMIVKNILSKHIWPDPIISGANGNRAICNVIQHVDPATREAYLPLMRQAVLAGKLEARYLVRSEDRVATDKGELQIYGGQMKFYPETKSFNVWPVYDPVNIDKRRADIGLGPIADWLLQRFDFEWNLEEQIQRTAEFLEKKGGSR